MFLIKFQVNKLMFCGKVVLRSVWFLGFLEKNRDSFSLDLKNLIQNSSNVSLKKLFENDFKEDSKNKRNITLSSQFRNSVEVLMKNLSTCHPYFIRCIKPNEFKKPGVSKQIFIYFEFLNVFLICF